MNKFIFLFCVCVCVCMWLEALRRLSLHDVGSVRATAANVEKATGIREYRNIRAVLGPKLPDIAVMLSIVVVARTSRFENVFSERKKKKL